MKLYDKWLIMYRSLTVPFYHVTGGGSLGCQTQYHLAKMGVTNTVLLEKHNLTAGTTSHTAGENCLTAWHTALPQVRTF